MNPKNNRNYTETTTARVLFEEDLKERHIIPKTRTYGLGEDIEFTEVVEVDGRTVQVDTDGQDTDTKKELVRYAVQTIANRIILPALCIVLIAWGIASALKYLSAFPEFWYAVLILVCLSVLVAIVQVRTRKPEAHDDLPGWKGSKTVKKEVTIINNVTIKNEVQ